MAMGDMNVAPLMKEIELYECIIPFFALSREELGRRNPCQLASSPNSTVSSISTGKKELVGDHEHEGKRTSCSPGSDEDGGSSCSGNASGGDGEGRRKLQVWREQMMVLEETFKEHSTLNPVSGHFSKFLIIESVDESLFVE
ncbi:hypothetical protein CDL15_Pgr018473 [Punica granatum]|uniref:Uncharacterized protein n=1 Tax=Punica granatum TaxID=22663 RepID=A0A218WYW7_PUNGR|nr:hypothetical protein CDL15_Pgr018473 [Punica granatum]